MFTGIAADPDAGRVRRPGAVWDQASGTWVTHGGGQPLSAEQLRERQTGNGYTIP
jgi:hypothetical protein